MMSHEHRRDQKISTGFAILTTSDSRTKENDDTGRIAKELIQSNHHIIVEYDIVKNDAAAISDRINDYLNNPEIRVIIISGGTGVGKRDLTIRTVVPRFEKHLIGFGELFRRLSYEELGVPGIYSQASAGIIGNTIVYCLPGSTNAMKTALAKIILPGIGHLIWEIDR
ncbi:MAG: molybdenum cofactor biosynthesis protein B [Candidatus Thorarchaeota archaeon]